MCSSYASLNDARALSEDKRWGNRVHRTWLVLDSSIRSYTPQVASSLKLVNIMVRLIDPNFDPIMIWFYATAWQSMFNADSLEKFEAFAAFYLKLRRKRTNLNGSIVYKGIAKLHDFCVHLQFVPGPLLLNGWIITKDFETVFRASWQHHKMPSKGHR